MQNWYTPGRRLYMDGSVWMLVTAMCYNNYTPNRH